MNPKIESQMILNKIYSLSGISYFENDLRLTLEEIIAELFISDNHKLLLELRINHIDRAIFKFKQAKDKSYIRNTKQYFKACLISAIKETGLDNLEPLDLSID